MLIPNVKRTWAPRGQTPKLAYNFKHKKVSAITALAVSPKRRRLALYLHFRRRSFKGADVLRFLRSLVAQIAGPIVALWDGAPIHRNGAIKDFLAKHPRLHMEQFPGYAPELNPAEFIWCQTDADLANSLLVTRIICWPAWTASVASLGAPSYCSGRASMHPTCRGASVYHYLYEHQ